MRTILNGLRKVLFWAVVLVSAVVIVLTLLPKLLGYTPVGVRDVSMGPVLHCGDLVLAKPIAFEDIRVGDVLIFADPKTGEQFTRMVADVWEKEQELATTAPDADSPDPYTTAYRCVVGKAAHTIRFAGYPAVWLHTRIAKIIFILLLIIWIAAEIESVSTSKRREKSNA